MIRRSYGPLVRLMLGAAILATSPVMANAQTAAPPPGPLAKPNTNPRDFTGVWQTPGYQYRFVPADGSPTPWQPWAKAEYEARQKAQKDGIPLSDSTARCMPSGMPRIMAAPYPIKILQTPKEVVILHEVQHLMRFIYLNEEHPNELDRTFMGHSVGRWEGDTLVVDTTANSTQTLLDEAGDPHSDKLHVVERIRKIDGGKRLENMITIDDPGAYTKPWVTVRYYDWKPEIRFMEYICEENNRNATDANGIVGAGLNISAPPR
jgi:hypothetical protein